MINVIQTTAEPGIIINQAIDCPLFTEWLKKVDREKFKINSVHFQSLDLFGSRVGFLKFKCDVTDQEGNIIPGIIFARGGSVAVIAVLECQGEEYVAVTDQPRLATGNFNFVEVCAGMLDDSGAFSGVAAKELKEELGIELKANDLTDLTELAGYKDGVYLSPGVCDETMRFFAFRKKVSKEELAHLNGKETGAAGENEKITVRLVGLGDLLHIPDAKTIVALCLFQNFCDQIPLRD